MSNSSSERTEKATPRRLKEARSEGRLANSRDLISWLSLGAAALMIPVVAGSVQSATVVTMAGISAVIADPEPDTARVLFGQALSAIPAAVAPMLAAALVGAVIGATLQGGVHFRRLKFSLEHLNVVKGVGRMFGRQALWEGAKALLKTAAVGAALLVAIQGMTPLLSTSGSLDLPAVTAVAAGVFGTLLTAAIVAGLALAAVDVFVVIRRNRRQTMMTKQEFKDEAKQSDGDPRMRQMRRSRQLSMSRNRMIAAVSKADVVLLNPTHYAVAIQYEPGKSAPRVVAKGADAIAARIREKAIEARVPMVEDPPLTRTLYAACKVGQEIPEDTYAAVARVLAFVMSLRRRGAALGTHRMSTVPTRSGAR